MKKPTKWTEKDYNPEDRAESWMAEGRNKAIEEYEAFLPDEKEILKIINRLNWEEKNGLVRYPTLTLYESLAKAVAKRIGKD